MIDVTTDYNKLLAESLGNPFSFGRIHDKNEWDPDRVYIYKFRWEKTEGSLLLDKYFTYGVKKNEEYKREAWEMWQHFNIRAYPEYGITEKYLSDAIFAPDDFLDKSESLPNYCKNYLNKRLNDAEGFVKRGYSQNHLERVMKALGKLPEIDKKWNEEK